MSKNIFSQKFEPNLEAEKVILSAKQAIMAILQMNSEVLKEHKRALISRMIWKITEAHGKYNTRYCSGRGTTGRRYASA